MTDEDFEPEDFEELMDEAEDDTDDAEEIRENQVDAYAGTYPEQRKNNDLYSWFWKVVRLKKPFYSVKVGNLDSKEIGPHNIPVREALNLWVLGHRFGHPTFGNYFAQSAKITAATSMSKKGWFMDLSISQKKVRERSKNRQGTEESWRVFKKNKDQQGQEQ